MNNKRFGIIALSLAGLVGLGYIAYQANRAPSAAPAAAAPAPGGPGKPGAGGPPAGFPTAVEVAAVKAVDFADEVTAVGTLKSNESVVLRPETAGRVASIGFRDGAMVSKGAVLVTLDAAIQEAELAQARANLSLAKSTFQRNQELLGKKFISQQALDSSAATLGVQEAAVQLAEAKLARTRIKAPFSGVVGLRNVSVGDFVKEGADLINIEDISSLRVDFRLPETTLGRLAKGQQIEVSSDAVPGRPFKAVLDALDPQIDPNGRSVAARARLDNAGGLLRPGMFVRVRLVFGQRQGALMVPEQAIVPGAQPAVFVVADGKATLKKVKLGSRRTGEVEVSEGLSAGQLVVTAGQMKLREGANVRPVGAGAPAQPAAMAGPGMAANQSAGGMSGMTGMDGMGGMAVMAGMAVGK